MHPVNSKGDFPDAFIRESRSAKGPDGRCASVFREKRGTSQVNHPARSMKDRC